MRGVIHSFDLTKASVHDLHYLNDVNIEMEDCTLTGNKAYLGKEVQLDLFTTSNIVLEVPMRVNQKEYKPQFPVLKKIRKRIETVFSQLDGQFMLGLNYAKDIDGLFTRVLAKISALTVLQYINKFSKYNLAPFAGLPHSLSVGSRTGSPDEKPGFPLHLVSEGKSSTYSFQYVSLLKAGCH